MTPCSHTASRAAAQAIAALALCMALAGCSIASPGAQHSLPTVEQREQVANTKSVSFSQPVEAHKLLACQLDPQGAQSDISVFPTRTIDRLTPIGGYDIPTGSDDVNSAFEGTVLLMAPGIQVTLPDSWQIASTDDGFDLLSPDDGVCGCVSSWPVGEGVSEDVAYLACSLPHRMVDAQTCTDVRIVHYENLYSTNGTFCSTLIVFVSTVDEQDVVTMAQYVLGRTQLSLLFFEADSRSFYANLDDLISVQKSLAFSVGEEA